MGVQEILDLASKGGVVGLILGVVAVIVTIIGGLLLKNRAIVPVGDKQKIVDTTQITGIQTKLDEIEKRMTGLEQEVHDRATREEVHKLELSMERLNGRMDVNNTELKSVGAGVTRIEDFMLAVSRQSIRARGD